MKAGFGKILYLLFGILQWNLLFAHDTDNAITICNRNDHWRSLLELGRDSVPGKDKSTKPETGYSLVWVDEFNHDGPPDSSNWTYERGFVRNNELQWYRPQNAWCQGGLLIIQACREQIPNPIFEAGSRDWRKNRPDINYTSACLITAGRKTWKYGRFEMRARFDIQPGMWPAWWTLGIEKRWPANGEIDIMEYYRGMLLANIACLGSNNKPEWHSTTVSVDSLGGMNWSERFHTWRMDWDEESIALYVDNHLLNKVPIAALTDKDGSNFNPFKQPHYMLLNLAVGGMNGGDPAKTTFPRRFEVDYVRVYQKDSGIGK